MRVRKGKASKNTRSMSMPELQKLVRVATEQMRRLSQQIAWAEAEMKRRGNPNG